MKRIKFYNILIALCFGISLTNFGQDKIITLSNNQSGSNHNIVARDAVILKEGFSFDATTGGSYTFTARTDESIVCDVEYITGDDIPDADDRQLNIIDLPVGTTPGSFNVSGSGAGTYSIPIVVPPGTAGMQPSISVNYNSQSGNGSMGMGWNLGGISSIARVPSTIYHDGVVDGVDFDGLDRFSLDGRRLIMTSGIYGASNSTYGTENETFTLITAKNSTGTNPQYFTVETKDGKTLTFGGTTDSRFIPKNGTYALTWYLSSVEDIQGNYMEYIYHNVQADGEFWLEEIKYTGNGSEDPYNSVKFFYEEREDIEVGYTGGTEIKQKGLLYKIKTLAEDDQLVREYLFEYATDFNYSHLVKVTEHGADGSELNSTVFEYEETTNNLNPYDTYESPNFNRFVFGDFNADGREDFISYEIKEDYTTSDLLKIYTANEDGYNFTEYHSKSVSDYFDGFVTVGDFNGDGQMDWVERENLGGDSRRYRTYINKTTSTSIAVTFDHEISVIDYEGDGESDFFVKRNALYNGEWWWYIYDRQGTLKKSGTIDSWSDDYDASFGPNNMILDFNGDGRSDVLVRNGLDLWVYGIPTTGTEMELLFEGPDPVIFGDFTRIHFGDFNGDNKTDILVLGELITNAWFLYSDGTNFRIHATNAFNGYPFVGSNKVFAQDINGDGKTDLIFQGRGNNVINPLNRINIGYCTGNDFTISETITSFNFDLTQEGLYRDMYGREAFSLGDFNGDGKKDIFYNYKRYDGSDTNTEIEKIFFLNKEQKEHSLRKILNGLNHKTEIAYQPLSSGENYTKTSTTEEEIIDFQGALYVVSEVNADNGVGGTNTTSYSYQGARIHREGKGFLGFSQVTTHDQATNIENIIKNNYYVESYPNRFYGQYVSEVNTKIHNGDLLSQVTYTYSAKDFGNRRFFPYAWSIYSKNNLENTSKQEYLFYSEESDWNIDLHSTTYSENEVANKLINISYDAYVDAISTDNNSYKNAPSEIRISESHAVDHYYNGYERTENFYYNSNGTLQKSINDLGKSKQITKEYTYYDSGYKKGLVERLTLKNTAGYDNRYTDYEYDSKGRAVTKQTDVLGNWVENTYDWRWGSILTKTSSVGSEITNTYDAFGRLLTSLANTGESSTQVYAWEDNSLEKGRFSVAVTGNDGSYGKEYFDVLGRSVRKTGKSFNGTTVYSDNRYRADGKLNYVSEPYFSGIPRKTLYTYLNNGRINYIEQPTATIDYSYPGGSTVTVTNTSAQPNQTSSKTFDAAGNLISATDAGGTISYKYHPSGQVDTIECNGNLIVMEYDEYGMQTKLDDPDAGVITYDYTPYGELKTQQDEKMGVGENYTMTYDQLGRILTQIGPDGTVTYEYYDAVEGGQLKKVSKSGTTNSVEYEYDEYGRLDVETHKYETKTFEYEYDYDSKNRLSKLTYPSGFIVKYVYNSYGYLSKITDNSGNMIWEGTSTNQFGQWKEFKHGNGLITKRTYDAYGMPQTIKTGTTGDDDLIQYNEYQFEVTTGNLNWRTNHKRSLTENFDYDKLNRLTEISGTTAMEIDYKGTIGSITNGNIDSKTNIGSYEYLLPQPHAVSKINNPGSEISSEPQAIEYTPFNKIEKITEEDYELDVDYDPFDGRIKTVLKENNVDKIIKYFVNNYEEVTEDGTTKKRHFISTPAGVTAVMEKEGTVETVYYIHTDYLGSIEYITKSDGSIEQELSYDAWGRLRNPANWAEKGSITPRFDRGYTMHEHLPMFSLINMNGRVYDPALGRMLSPDNFIQSPAFTQNYNRYSYCLNNPLIYTDPSGMSLKSWWNDLKDIYHGMGEGFKIWGQYAGAIYAGAGYAMFTLYTGGHHSSWEGFNKAISIGSNIGGAVGYFYGNVAASTAKTVLSSFATYGIGAGLSYAFNNLNWIGSTDRLWANYNNRTWISAAEWLAEEYPGTGNAINTAFSEAGNLVSLANFLTDPGLGGYVPRNYDFTKFHWRFGLQEGLGINASFELAGNISVYEQQGEYFSQVSLSGLTGNSDANWYGNVEVYDGKELVGSLRLNSNTRAYTNNDYIGQVTFNLPTELSKNVSLKINGGYYINNPEGRLYVRPGRHKIRLQRYYKGFIY